MRMLVALVAILLGGCASIEDLTHLSCTPSFSPNDVTLKREAYLYKIEGESDISLWNSPLRYGQGLGESKHLIIHTPPPLYTLAPGTRLTITRVTRETHFDNPPNVIHVKGVAHLAGADVPFIYSWGIGNHVNYAPWETETYNPSDFSRTMQCKT
jgi:hypothetical protein